MQPQHFGALESEEPVSYKWQPDARGYGNDFSQWLHQSTQQSPLCLPYQTSLGHTANGEDSPMPLFSFGLSSNALGLENLFSNVDGNSKAPISASPLQLLARPITPFAF